MKFFSHILNKVSTWFENKINQIGQENRPLETDHDIGVEEEPWIGPSDFPGCDREDLGFWHDK